MKIWENRAIPYIDIKLENRDPSISYLEFTFKVKYGMFKFEHIQYHLLYDPKGMWILSGKRMTVL